MRYNQMQPVTFWLLDSGSSVQPAGPNRYESKVRDYDLSEHI
jgi:hypothetical protein